MLHVLLDATTDHRGITPLVKHRTHLTRLLSCRRTCSGPSTVSGMSARRIYDGPERVTERNRSPTHQSSARRHTGTTRVPGGRTTALARCYQYISTGFIPGGSYS